MRRDLLDGTLAIDSVKDLSAEDAIRLKGKYKNIKIMSQAFEHRYYDTLKAGRDQQDLYDIDEYIVCREKLDELIEGINPNSSDLEKFAEVYYRVCKNITYDTTAAYPKSKLQEQYEEANVFRCRDLRNGLIDGKAVCSGYADILRAALNLVGVEAVFCDGPTNSNVIDEKIIDHFRANLLTGKNLKVLKARVRIRRNIFRKIIEKHLKALHAWNRVKIDGEWYNCDATWDRYYIAKGKIPLNALKSTKKCEINGKYCKGGPECKRDFPKKELKKAFKKVYEKHETKIAAKNIFRKITKKVMDMYAKILSLKTSTVDNGLDFEKSIINNKKEREKFEQDAGFTINELMRMGFSVNDIKRLNSEKGEKRSDIIRSEIEQKKTEKSEKKVLPFWDLRNWKGYSNQDNKTESMVNKTELENKDSNTINEAKQQDDER